MAEIESPNGTIRINTDAAEPEKFALTVALGAHQRMRIDVDRTEMIAIAARLMMSATLTWNPTAIDAHAVHDFKDES